MPLDCILKVCHLKCFCIIYIFPQLRNAKKRTSFKKMVLKPSTTDSSNCIYVSGLILMKYNLSKKNQTALNIILL